jgi:hypothetical protein
MGAVDPVLGALEFPAALFAPVIKRYTFHYASHFTV